MAFGKNGIRVALLLLVASVELAAGGKSRKVKNGDGGKTEAHAAGGDKGWFDVTKLGACGDGKTDNTKALTAAWEAACAAGGRPTVVVPKGDFLVGPLVFSGPCKGAVTIRLDGNLVGKTDLGLYKKHWINIEHIDNFAITGHGKIDGQGAAVWGKCHHCKKFPNSLALGHVSNATVCGIKLVNSKFFHMKVFSSKGVSVRDITVSAPADSPNTDGIHVADSTDISITGAVIGTGDDCISIGPGSSRVSITGVRCGPGHGISVGSLGKYEHERDVTDITVRDCLITGTTNGIRIKSYEDSKSALCASTLLYENVKMINVANPIIIDQNYCPNNDCTKHGDTKVTVRDVTFRNVTGTSATAAAVSLLCAHKLPCDGVKLINIDLKYTGRDNKTTAVCNNVHGSCSGTAKALACL